MSLIFNSVRKRRVLRHLCTTVTVSLMGLQIMAVLCALTKPAYGYVDPGSGLLAFQMLSTTFAGAVFMVRKRLRFFFGRHIFGIGNSTPKDESVDQKLD